MVESRDSFDEAIENLCEAESRLIRSFGIFFCWVIRLARSLLRGLLAVAIRAGRVLTVAEQLRADAAAVRLAGPAEFRAMLRQLPILEGGIRLAGRNLARCVRESHPDNVPEFVAETLRRLPSRVRAEIQDQAASHPTVESRLLPSATLRCDESMKLGRSGLVRLEVPASELFADYPALCRSVSITHYLDCFGEETARRAWPMDNARFVHENEDPAFGLSLRDEMIDYHEGDRWYKWRQRASTVGGLLMTAALLFHTANQMIIATRPAEEVYRGYIGRAVLVPGVGFREILDVKSFKQGEVVWSDTDEEWGTEDTVQAPSTGWFYDTGEGHIVRCDKSTPDSNMADPDDLGLNQELLPAEVKEALESL